MIYTKQKDKIIEKKADLICAHNEMLSILKEIDRVAFKYNIRYSTFGGTMLGQIRHKGFIPWDDDADIFLTRENFEKFKIAWKKEDNKKFKFYDFGEFEELLIIPKVTLKNPVTKKEFWVDFFILDKAAKTMTKCKIHTIFLKIYYGLLCSKQIKSNVPPITHKTYEKIGLFSLRIIGHLFTKKFLLSRYKKLSTKYEKTLSTKYYASNSMGGTDFIYDKEDIIESVRLPFENVELMCFKKYDKCLRMVYNNYMELPISNFKEYAEHFHNSEYSVENAIFDYANLK